jgi:hypothetical protein
MSPFDAGTLLLLEVYLHSDRKSLTSFIEQGSRLFHECDEQRLTSLLQREFDLIPRPLRVGKAKAWWLALRLKAPFLLCF